VPALVAAAAGGAIADDLAVGRRVLHRRLPQRTAAKAVAELGPPDAPRTLVVTPITTPPTPGWSSTRPSPRPPSATPGA
jgi:hypothetical protein